MSRIGKRPIVSQSGVKMTLGEGCLKVEGPKGSLALNIGARKSVEVRLTDKEFKVERKADSRDARREQGLLRALVANMVLGVTKGFSKELDIVGVGYKGEVKGNIFNLELGFSHPIEFEIPKGIKISVEKQTHIKIEGADKHMVGETSARIRRLREPEPYKGKGVKYSSEVIKRKVGKAAVGTGTAGAPAKGG